LGEVYKMDLEYGALSAVKTFSAALSHFVTPHIQWVGCQSISNLFGGFLRVESLNRVLKKNRYCFIFEWDAWEC